MSDISAYKQSEDKVRVSEIRYRRLFETAHDGVLLLDPATRKITEANPFMTKLLGYSHDQFVGKELFEIGLLKDEAASREMFQKLKRDREVRYEDLPLESQHGRHQEVEVVANLYQENGHAVIQCNIRDITARKLAEQEISEKARLLDLSHDAIIVRDVQGRIRYWNHGAEELYGWSRKEALGKISHRLFHTQYITPLKQLTEELHRTNRWTGELVHQTRDGRRLTVLVRKTLDRDRHGHPASVLETITDMTERKLAEAAMRRFEVVAASNQKLETEIARRRIVEEALRKSEQHQRRLLAQSNRQQEQLRQLSRQILTVQEEERRTISRELHDVIAQTLTGINIRLAGLKQEATRSTKGLDQKIASTQRLVEKSVDIVHQFARELRPTVLDDLGLIPALHAFMKTFTAQTGVRASLTASAEVEHLDTTQRTVLYRVAQEALTNVARHAHASRVEVSIRKFPGHIGMKVQDDGKSFRVEPTSPANGGTRLGLLGMKERLEMIGGTFTIESAPGQGTTIGAEIPLRVRRARGARLEHAATQS
jgi:PAS domain S-box-containing protein